MPTASALEVQLLALPETERLRLVGVLLRSLDPEPADPVAQAAWWDEIQRRLRAPAESSASLQAMRKRFGYPQK
ncbi:MAG: addiction module protein [Myxococcota bacterium]|nr:addiction module protein [Myxococcota bacterium]